MKGRAVQIEAKKYKTTSFRLLSFKPPATYIWIPEGVPFYFIVSIQE
jgi:hypothetical protein